MRRRSAVGLGVVVVVIALAVTAVQVKQRRDAALAAERRAVRRYVAAITPAAKRGGEIVVTEIRPRLSDLRNDAVAPDQFIREAQRWHRDLEAVRKTFASAPAPPRLARARTLFDRSLAGYIAAVDRMAAAAPLPKAERDAALDAAIEIAERADKTYDRADDVLAAEAKRLGMETRVG